MALISHLPGWMKYKFYDTPDDQDGLLKVWALCKKTGRVALTMVLFDVLLSTEKRTTMQKFSKIPKYFIPIFGMSAAFVVVMQTTTKALPSLDHKVHYGLGGLATAGVLGHCMKSPLIAFNTSFLFVAAGVCYQYARERREIFKGTVWEPLWHFDPKPDWEFMIQEKRRTGNWFFAQQDYRLMTRPERNTNINLMPVN